MLKMKNMITEEYEIKNKIKNAKICKIHKIKYTGRECPVCKSTKK